MNHRLYIIGNGFDLHHGIPSSYQAFGHYLRHVDTHTFKLVEEYFDVDDGFWSDFEDRLADFDAYTLVENASQFLVGYGADDWSESGHHDYQYEIDRVVEAISRSMRERFVEWIRQLAIPPASAIGDCRLAVESDATFLNFNYTPSLQLLYGVPDRNILHIHGSAADPTSRLVLGHGWEPKDVDPYQGTIVPEDVDTRVAEGRTIINGYFKDTFKPTKKIIADKRRFFEGLAHIEEVFVMGHSVAHVDHAYFSEVVAHVDRNKVRWKVSYHESPVEVRARFSDFGVDPSLVEFLPLAKF